MRPIRYFVRVLSTVVNTLLVVRASQWAGRSARTIPISGSKPYTVVMIVPTGIGASIGGYAGDALPSARLLASVADRLITHPNVMNGAMLYWLEDNILYVEGYALDEFAQGNIGLREIGKGGHNIGLILDSGMEEELTIRHIQVANAARATLGLNVAACVTTSNPIGVKVADVTDSGAAWGCIENISTLIEAANALVAKGCSAIAVVARFPEEEDSDIANAAFEAYRQGKGVDRIAGVEALISHIITKTVKRPCAHAPAFAPSTADDSVSPKACAEELGYTYLPCVLSYLHRAPSLIELKQSQSEKRDSDITAEDVDAVVVPVDALGGAAVLSFLAAGKLIVAVEDNETVMKVSPEDLVKEANSVGVSVVRARSYAEAAGILCAHKAGILLESITCRVPPLTVTKL